MARASARECYLNEQVNKYGLLCIIYCIMRITKWIMDIVIFVSFVIHWFRNDTMSFIQMLKWSFSTYALLWIYIVFWFFFYNFKVKDDLSTYKSFKRQLSNERRLHGSQSDNNT